MGDAEVLTLTKADPFGDHQQNGVACLWGHPSKSAFWKGINRAECWSDWVCFLPQTTIVIVLGEKC